MLVNKDLTRASITLHITNNQIYAEIWSKSHGKWEKDTYFQSYDWEVSMDMVDTTISYIIRTWNLKNPKVILGD